jgi:hypothetical protein
MPVLGFTLLKHVFFTKLYLSPTLTAILNADFSSRTAKYTSRNSGIVYLRWRNTFSINMPEISGDGGYPEFGL